MKTTQTTVQTVRNGNANLPTTITISISEHAALVAVAEQQKREHAALVELNEIAWGFYHCVDGSNTYQYLRGRLEKLQAADTARQEAQLAAVR